jgi:hypothetical protein
MSAIPLYGIFEGAKVRLFSRWGVIRVLLREVLIGAAFLKRWIGLGVQPVSQAVDDFL